MTTTRARPTPTRLDPRLLDLLLHEHVHQRRPRLERLWRYYRNPLTHLDTLAPGDGEHPRRYHLAQEAGLPRRITGSNDAGLADRERVIENDIGWRIHTLVDFMFGRPVVVQSLAPDPARAPLIERFLRHVFEQHGGVSFFQDLALLGSVYGFVDVLVQVSRRATRRGATDDPAAAILLDTIDAPRAIPVLRPDDYRRLDAYLLHMHEQTHDLEPSPRLARVRQRVLGGAPAARRAVRERVAVWSPDQVQHYVGQRGVAGGVQRRLVGTEVNRLGRIPVVHIQNLPQPFFYEGLSDVEPLIPLQDELNTRLSDRANRVTFQCFKMYLGKGIEGFLDRPVGPGQMWSTDNADASIEQFGGDAANPSEDAHIQEIRDALDKTSGVTPVAAGLIRDRVGNLTSENALRIVLMGLLARTEKKRVTYGAGIERLCELMLHAADVHGLLPNAPEERRVRLDWPNPLPDSETQRLRNAALEGDDAPAARFTNRSRRVNYTQIFTAAVEVSGSQLAARQLAVADELDYQKQERLRELIRDLENCVINGVAASSNPEGSASVRRTMKGIIPFLSSNVTDAGGAALDEATLNAALRAIWEQSNGQVDTIAVSGVQKRRINGFVTATRSFDDKTTRFRDLVSVYESDFGVCRVVLSRWVPPDAVLLLDSSRIDVLPLAGRSFHFKKLASTGDRDAGQVIGEYTLELRNENAHGLIHNLATS